MVTWGWLESWRNLQRTKHTPWQDAFKKSIAFKLNLFLQEEPISKNCRTTSALPLFLLCLPVTEGGVYLVLGPASLCVCISRQIPFSHTLSVPPIQPPPPLMRRDPENKKDMGGWNLRTSISIWTCVYSDCSILFAYLFILERAIYLKQFP